MNGVHDVGGMHGLGPLEREAKEPMFHHAWERRIFALNVASGYLRRWNIDMSRHSRERMPAAEYLAASYYERWLYGLRLLLAESGLVTREELQARDGAAGSPTAPAPPPSGLRILRAADVERALTMGTARVDADVPARFKPGDAVVARNIHPAGHTRLPRYARGKRGVVDRDHGVWVFPDAYASGQGKKPQRCYSVRFEARELWGSEASARDAVYIDMFDDYLDTA